MNKTLIQRQELNCNLNQNLKTIFKGKQSIDNIIKTTTNNKLLKIYLKLEKNLKKVEKHIQKMKYYNNKEMDYKLKKEMQKLSDAMTQVFNSNELNSF